jgi:hypothetical protein
VKKQIGLLAVVFLVVGLFIAGCGGSTGKATDAPEATVKPTPTAEPTQEIAGVGYYIEWTDVRVSLVEAGVYSDYNEYFAPDAGNKFVSVLVEYEALANGVSYNPFFWTLRDSQGFSYNYYIFGKEPALDSSNELQAGRKVKGWLTFQVPVGETQFYLAMDDYTHSGEWQFTTK